MDDQFVVWELEVQQLEQVAGGVWADAEALGYFLVGVDVIEGNGVVPCVLELFVGQAVAVRRRMYLHRPKCNTFKPKMEQDQTYRSRVDVREWSRARYGAEPGHRGGWSGLEYCGIFTGSAHRLTHGAPLSELRPHRVTFGSRQRAIVNADLSGGRTAHEQMAILRAGM